MEFQQLIQKLPKVMPITVKQLIAMQSIINDSFNKNRNENLYSDVQIIARVFKRDNQLYFTDDTAIYLYYYSGFDTFPASLNPNQYWKMTLREHQSFQQNQNSNRKWTFQIVKKQQIQAGNIITLHFSKVIQVNKIISDISSKMIIQHQKFEQEQNQRQIKKDKISFQIKNILKIEGYILESELMEKLQQQKFENNLLKEVLTQLTNRNQVGKSNTEDGLLYMNLQ